MLFRKKIPKKNNQIRTNEGEVAIGEIAISIGAIGEIAISIGAIAIGEIAIAIEASRDRAMR